MKNQNAILVPMLYLRNLATAIDFYTKALDAVERWRVSNPDGGVHVAEMVIGDAVFRMHEEVGRDQNLSPEALGGTTVVLGLLVADPDAVVAQAVAAGATVLSPMKDYEYGYRQGTIKDPFGHHWLIERQSTKPPFGQ